MVLVEAVQQMWPWSVMPPGDGLASLREVYHLGCFGPKKCRRPLAPVSTRLDAIAET